MNIHSVMGKVGRILLAGSCSVLLLAAKDAQPVRNSDRGASAAMAKQSNDEIVITGSEPAKQSAQPVLPAQKKGAYTLGSFWELFSTDISLAIPLHDVIVLVILVNIFALFKKARFIMATSYLFTLKWVFWSNYAELLKYSDTIARGSVWVFILCGILTLILFVVNYFNRS